MLLSLYLHFPFCKQKCLYCDFCSAPRTEEEVRRYCAALCREIRAEGEKFPSAEVNTVFLGGGTPSLVPPDALTMVLRALRESFHLLPGCEFSSEANPGTLTEEWLSAAVAGGLNRLSLGMQAAQDRLLKTLGRIHTFEETREAVRMARRTGIANLNLDLMFGLPGQTAADWEETLSEACALEPEHLSAYSLIPEEGTPLVRLLDAGALALPDEDLTADLSERTVSFLREKGYGRYEISNYAKAGFRCRHNLGYWQGARYLGLGIAAHSYLPAAGEADAGLRRANTENLTDYLRTAENGDFDRVRETQTISRAERIREVIMLALRTSDGIREADYRAAFGVSFQQTHEAVIGPLVREGLAVRTPAAFSLTDRGMAVQNAVLLRFPEWSE